MAIATIFKIKFTCGHTENTDLSPIPAGQRKAKTCGLGKNFVCSRCFRSSNQEDLDRYNQQQLIDAFAFDEEHGMPELVGSVKQVPWATRNRYQVLTAIIDSEGTHAGQTVAEQVIEAAKSMTRAGWWLDNTTNKDLDVEDLVELITTAIDEREPIATENPY